MRCGSSTSNPVTLSTVGIALSLTFLLGCQGDASRPTDVISAMQCLPETCGGGGGGGGGGEGGYPTSDPDPAAPGMWIGQNVGLSRCYSPTGAGINDADADRFDDWCEQWIAYTFRPALRTDPSDCDLRREPTWAVKYVPSRGVVRVAYFLSYYQDCGNQHAFVCNVSSPNYQECSGHDGDSEFLILDLRYQAATDHYLAQQMFFSAHYQGGTWSDFSASVWYTHLEYPTKYRAYPRVWASLGKHANYFDQHTCNVGSAFNSDTCASNTNETRMEFDFSRNVGSPQHHMLDCTPATPAMQYYRGGIECYWDGFDPAQQPPAEKFFGWWDPGANPYSGGASPHGPFIRDVFEPPTLPCSPRPEFENRCTS